MHGEIYNTQTKLTWYLSKPVIFPETFIGSV